MVVRMGRRSTKKEVPGSSTSQVLTLISIGLLACFSVYWNADETFSRVVAKATESYATMAANLLPGGNLTIANTTSKSNNTVASSSTTAPGNTTNKSNNNTKPNLIIHIGPSKTATTTIQTLLHKNNWALKRDRYELVGFQIRPLPSAEHVSSEIYQKLILRYWNCWNQDKIVQQGSEISLDKTYAAMQEEECWQRNVQKLNEIINKTNPSIIISDEAMSQGHKRFMYRQPHGILQLRLFANELQARWNVKIVIVYRRYCDWILSAFKEANSKILYTSGKWPDKGGKPLLRAWRAIEYWMEHPDSIIKFFLYQYPDRTKELWGKAFETIEIVNFHYPRDDDDDPSGLFSHFICNVVPDANEACARSLNNSSGNNGVHRNARQVDTTAYDHIVWEAKNRFPNTTAFKSLDRKKAAYKFQEFHQTKLGQSWTDLPLTCPTHKQLERLLNLSLAKEKDLLPDFFRTHEQEHRAFFWRMANEKKSYCSVDLDALFGDKKSWQEVLDSLK